MTVSYTQNLVGVWQAKSNEITSAYYETYVFFENGEFIFNSNQYDGLRTIISISGNFTLDGENIIFCVNKIKESVNGKISRSELTTYNNSWSFEADNIVEREIEEIDFIAKFKFCSLTECLIDNQKFYLLSNNPLDW